MKLFFTFASFIMIVSFANATVHTVTCQNSPSHFLPVTVDAVVGDTIRWVWVLGTHIVGPIDTSDIPNGAASWSAPIDGGNFSFEYVVSVPGNYHYVCHPSTPHGENAYIQVSKATGVKENITLSAPAIIYPNPSSGKYQILIKPSLIAQNSKVEIYDLSGQMVYSSLIRNAVSFIDLTDQPKGVYLVKFYSGQAVFTKRIVKL